MLSPCSKVDDEADRKPAKSEGDCLDMDASVTFCEEIVRPRESLTRSTATEPGPAADKEPLMEATMSTMS